HKKVEQPIVVVIEPPRGYRPCLAELGDETADSRLLGHIREGSVPIVMEKLVAVDAGHVEIDKSIIVVVAGGHSHRIADALQAGFFGYIGEGSVPVVAKEAVVVTGIALFQRRNGRTIGKENIQQTGVVVVEDGYSSHHGFKRIVLGTDAVLKFELDLRLFDNVLKLDGRCSRHHLIRGLFASSRSAGLRCLGLRCLRRGSWNGGGRWRLGKQAGNAPQQAKCQLRRENDSAPSGNGAGDTRGGLPVEMWQMLARI